MLGCRDRSRRYGGEEVCWADALEVCRTTMRFGKSVDEASVTVLFQAFRPSARPDLILPERFTPREIRQAINRALVQWNLDDPYSLRRLLDATFDHSTLPQPLVKSPPEQCAHLEPASEPSPVAEDPVLVDASVAPARLERQGAQPPASGVAARVEPSAKQIMAAARLVPAPSPPMAMAAGVSELSVGDLAGDAHQTTLLKRSKRRIAEDEGGSCNAQGPNAVADVGARPAAQLAPAPQKQRMTRASPTLRLSLPKAKPRDSVATRCIE